MKRISIGSWAYTIGPYEDKPVDFDTVCTRLRDLGFDGVELGGFPPHPNPVDMPEASPRQEVVAMRNDWGLSFSGLAANLWGEQLVNTTDQTKYIEEFTKNCAFCRDLGIKGIRVDTVQPPTMMDEIGWQTAFDRVTQTWSRCNEIAKDHGLYLTWEFEPGFLFNKPSDIVKVLDAVDDNNFGVMYDTSHGHMVSVVGARQPGEKETLPGGQIELIGMLSGRINHIHLIDSDNNCHKDQNGEDETSMHLPFGDGVVDFDPILKALAKENLSHDWWTIDLCFWPDAWDATEHCKRTVDTFVAEYT
ncbi:MAG: sugar phosphate isomerase/epimerase family protein [Planctomycetota bacterium]|nr:sugar phosphate isomerase/epimerase family protein [Planctomycetota bacterium]